MKRELFRALVKECVGGVLSEREDYHDGITRELRKARKEKNPEKILYYRQAFNKSAISGFDQFKGSWAYDLWKKQNANEIEKINQELKRYPWHEEAQPELYDPETDTFAPGPRDRLPGDEHRVKEGDEDGTSYGERDAQFGQDYPNPPEHNYDEKTEMKKINDILVVCEHGLRTNNTKYFPMVLKQIQKICLELLKMHGAK